MNKEKTTEESDVLKNVPQANAQPMFEYSLHVPGVLC
jgi:hypothetical protein